MKTSLRNKQVSAFTMVEIALCLAIVGFALVAIIGGLPIGLNVQKLNREETIINHDATIWMDALRSGSTGYNELAKYVDRVVVIGENGVSATYGPFTDGREIVGLMSTPGHRIHVYVRALSGSAVDKAPQDNPDVTSLAFSYRLQIENTPAASYDVAGGAALDNLTDVRLLFRWPLKGPIRAGNPVPDVGNSKLQYRTQLGGRVVQDTNNTALFFRQPHDY
jgi:hypothetical protein